MKEVHVNNFRPVIGTDEKGNRYEFESITHAAVWTKLVIQHKGTVPTVSGCISNVTRGKQRQNFVYKGITWAVNKKLIAEREGWKYFLECCSWKKLEKFSNYSYC